MTLDQYASLLKSAGFEDREVARAVLFAESYGLDALSGDSCITFGEPECDEGWNCLTPSHQIVQRS